MNAVLKNEYLKAVFTLGKHQEEHALCVSSCKPTNVFVSFTLEKGNGFVGYLFMSQCPRVPFSKCFKTVETAYMPSHKTI